MLMRQNHHVATVRIKRGKASIIMLLTRTGTYQNASWPSLQVKQNGKILYISKSFLYATGTSCGHIVAIRIFFAVFFVGTTGVAYMIQHEASVRLIKSRSFERARKGR
mmetsp:Transcript_33192/g.49165  ORF Transcript_33192/g.49165 Transcript_33192/m.49165 type:complete len:108 (+) Transcript_33192:570-893(+)